MQQKRRIVFIIGMPQCERIRHEKQQEMHNFDRKVSPTKENKYNLS